MSLFAPRIRALRRQQQRTMKDVADRCGFTVSLLSKIESGKTSPPVATLAKIAAALGVNLADLLADERPATTVLTLARDLASRPPTRTDKGYGFHLLAAGRAEKTMQPFFFVARRGEVIASPMTHAGQEFVHVLSGRMRYRVGATTYTLGRGDSLYFDSSEEHDLEPITATVCYLAVFTSPPAKPHRTPKPNR